MGHQTELPKVPSPKSPKECENFQKQKAYVNSNRKSVLVYSKPLYPCYMCRIVIKIGTRYIFLDG